MKKKNVSHARQAKSRRLARAVRGKASYPAGLHDPTNMFMLLLGFLCVLAAFLYSVDLGRETWLLLSACGLFVFAVEVLLNWRSGFEQRIFKALALGLLLAVFDFAVETFGAILGFWTTQGSFFPLGAVPLEVSFVCVFAGAAWALYLPRKFDARHSLFDVLTIAFFGVLFEGLLIKNGLMHYGHGWIPLCAFVSYCAVVAGLTFVKYRWLN